MLEALTDAVSKVVTGATKAPPEKPPAEMSPEELRAAWEKTERELRLMPTFQMGESEAQTRRRTFLHRREAELRRLVSLARQKAAQAPRPPAPEDPRVAKKREGKEKAAEGLKRAEGEARDAQDKLAAAEENDEPESARAKFINAVALAASNVNAARFALARAQRDEQTTRGAVLAEQREALAGVARAALASFAAKATAAGDARAGLVDAITAMRESNICGAVPEMPPLTFQAVDGYLVSCARVLGATAGNE